MIPNTANEAMVSNGLSAEQLGAYMEGNLPENEMAEVENMINDDPQIAELYDDVNNTQIDWSADILEDYPDFEDNFEMPAVETDDYHSFQLADNGLDSMSEYQHVQVPQEESTDDLTDEDEPQDYEDPEDIEDFEDDPNSLQATGDAEVEPEEYDEAGDSIAEF